MVAIGGTHQALAVLVAVFGITITSRVSIDAARTVVGVVLLLFGLKWLHKAILRSSGLKSVHDEAKIFEETKERLTATASVSSGLDRARVTTALSGVFLEGLEVVSSSDESRVAPESRDAALIAPAADR